MTSACRRYGRGSLRREGRTWVLRIRGEAKVAGERRPERVIRIGLISDLKTRTAAQLEADRRLVFMGLSGPLEGVRAKFDDYLQVYMASRVAILKPNSRSAFGTYARHLVRELHGRYLDELTVGLIQGVVAKLFARRLSRSTINSIIQFLRRLQRAARSEGIATIVVGPREVTLPKESRAHVAPRAFSLDETRRILGSAKWPWRALYAVQAYLGLRAGESLGLQWADIDFAAKHILLRRQAAKGELASMKSNGSAQPVPLPDELAALLRGYREAWTPNTAGLLFANPKGDPLWAEGVRRNHLQPLLKRLGIAQAGFHAWRHAMATELFRGGAGAAAIQRLARHSSINTTMKYSAVSFDDLRRASDAHAQRLNFGGEETVRCADTVSAAALDKANP